MRDGRRGELLVDERLRDQDLDPFAAGPDHALGSEVVEDPDDDLADRPDGVGEGLLAHAGDEPVALPLLGGEVEQVPRDALPDGREGAAGISATKLTTRSLSSSMTARATRRSRSARPITTSASKLTRSESTSAWTVAASE